MKKPALALLILAILGLAAWMWATPTDRADTIHSPATALAPPAVPLPKTGSRVPLPRPALPTRTGEPDTAPAGAAPDAPAPPGTLRHLTPDQRQERLGRVLPIPVPPDMTAVAVDLTIRDILPDMKKCLNAWGQADVTFTGRVALGFEIGADGLTDVWVEDVENIPAGPLTCLSGAIWEAPWPPFRDDTTVRYPFQVEVGDDLDAEG